MSKYSICVDLLAVVEVSARSKKEALAKLRKMPLQKQVDAVTEYNYMEFDEDSLVEEV